MAPTAIGHASSHESREAARDARRTRNPRDPALCPTDDEATVPRRKARHNKQSLEYLWRSGVAGGMAGCVVGSPLARICGAPG